MQIAIVQAPSPAGAVQEALSDVGRTLVACAAYGARLAVFPELFLPGYNAPSPADGARSAEEWDRVIAPLCARAGCALVVGLAETDAGRLFNSAMAWDQYGRRLAHYRKTQLFGDREKALFVPGERLSVFELDGVGTALLICYNVEFAPLLAELAARGVEQILCPTANMHPFDHVPSTIVPAQAASHGIAIAYANYCGTEGGLCYTGGSCLAARDGTVLARAGPGPALLIAELLPPDPARLSTQAQDLRLVT